MAETGEVTMLIEPQPRPPFLEAKPAAGVQAIDVSLAIVTWNSARWIERCLAAIPAACGDLTYEVVIYDNASSDDTLETIDRLQTAAAVGAAGKNRAQHPGPVIVRSDRNDGFAAATNRAASMSSSRYLFLLNPDCELAPASVTRLCDFLDGRVDVAAAAPLLTHENGDDQREFQLRKLPTLGSLASEVLLHRTTDRYRDMDLTHPQPVEQPAAAALLLRRDVFESAGGLDEQFAPAWFEDVDFCHRLALAGEKMYVVPAAGARHFGGASLEHMTFAGFADVWYRNMWRYGRKWMSAAEAETLRWIIIVGMLMRCLAALAGAAHPEVGRWSAFRAYSNVLGKAFRRWEPR